jgi:hypothetical protein
MYMPTLEVRIDVSTDGETRRIIADGKRYPDGTYRWEVVSEEPPSELLKAFERHLLEAPGNPLPFGSWGYAVGSTRYQVGFTSL